MKRKILITGAAGFLGSNLVGALLGRGYEVIGIDNFSYGSRENIEPFLKSSSFRLIEGDVLDSRLLQRAAEGVDTIFHFASYKIPRYGSALKTLEVNSKGTEQCLEAARKAQCRLIYASTEDVYGKTAEPLCSEASALVIGETQVSRWSDAVSKIYSEHLCYAYQERYGVPISIIRYFDVYGPNHRRDWWGGAPAVFIENALQDEPLPIHGDGAQMRSFIYVSDAIDGTVSVLENEYAIGEVVNIGSTVEISIINLAYLIWRLTGNRSKPKLEFVPYTDLAKSYEDVRRRLPDISKARYLLGFEPKVGLEEGLRRTIEWQRKQR